MKNSFNYSGFCKSAYSFNSKKSAAAAGGESATPENPALRIPPYLAQTPAARHLKGGA